MDRAEQLAVLSTAAADQWGLITTAQAKELGLNPVQLLRLTEAGLLENVSRGVYFLSTGGTPRHLDIKAAWLRLQPKTFAWDRPVGHPDSGVISHASACQLHELGDIPAPDVEITVPRRRTTTEPFVRLRTAPLEPTEITVVDGLPVTTAVRTITDLLQAKADGGHIGGVIAEAERRDLITVDDLAQRVQPYTRKYGLKATATGRELIDHLVAQAGESLRRQEVDRASQEGFDAAVHLFAEHPDVAMYLARNTGMSKALQDTNRQLAESSQASSKVLQNLLQSHTATAEAIRKATSLDPAVLASMRKAMELDPAVLAAMQKVMRPDPAMYAALRKITQPDSATTEALRKLTQPDSAFLKALRKTTALPPGTRKALEAAAESTITPQHSAPLPTPHSSTNGDPGDSNSEIGETG